MILDSQKPPVLWKTGGFLCYKMVGVSEMGFPHIPHGNPLLHKPCNQIYRKTQAKSGGGGEEHGK